MFPSTLRRSSLCLLLLLPIVVPANAQPAWPSKPVRVVVPAGPGSSVDNVTRLMSQHLEKKLNTTFIVENRPGALGAIGGAFVAKSAPDGYTLLMGAQDTQILGPLVNKHIVYSARDFIPVARISEASLLIAASAKAPVTTLAELIAYAKANPNKLTFASGGAGGIQHLSVEMLKSRADIQLLHVPYKSATDAAHGFMAGDVDLLSASPTFLASLIKSGKARGIAIMRETRHPLLPDVPTMAESGLPGYNVASWVSIFAPLGTPPDVVARLSGAVVEFANDPEAKRRLESTGQEAVPLGHEEFKKFMAEEWIKWDGVVKAARIESN